MFGPEDDFFNRLATYVRLLPTPPLIGGGDARLQPVFVGDVAKAIVTGLEGKVTTHAPYELGGPEILTLRQVMQRVLAYTHRKRLLLPMPFWLATLAAASLQRLSKPPLTIDQVRLLRTGNVVSDDARAAGRTLERLGIDPVAVAAVVPNYLVHFRPYGEFSTYRYRSWVNAAQTDGAKQKDRKRSTRSRIRG
jgi:NADH dehydrogenase